MNSNEWANKFNGYTVWLDTMLKAIPNFKDHKENYIIEKSRIYYTQLNTISLKILENRTMPYMRLNTFDMENRVEMAKELLKEASEKYNIPKEWESKLPDIKRKY